MGCSMIITLHDVAALPLWRLTYIETIMRRVHHTSNHLSTFDLHGLLVSTALGDLAQLPRKEMKFILRLIKELSK
jgi:hypothetical protein